MNDDLAIAYAIRKHRAKKMADGGSVPDPDSNMGKAFASIRGAFGGPKPEPKDKPKGYADGGMASTNDWAGVTGANAAGNKGINSNADWANIKGDNGSSADSIAASADGPSVKGRIGSALQGFGKGMASQPSSLSAFNSFARMAHGGIAKAIRAQKMAMSMGGEVESDEFLSADMPDESIEKETYPDPEDTEDKQNDRKGRLDKIMSGLHARHYGK